MFVGQIHSNAYFFYSPQVKMAFTFKTVLKNQKNNNILGHENHMKFKFQYPEITFH